MEDLEYCARLLFKLQKQFIIQLLWSYSLSNRNRLKIFKNNTENNEPIWIWWREMSIVRKEYYGMKYV
jgi:hypothetical protein